MSGAADREPSGVNGERPGAASGRVARIEPTPNGPFVYRPEGVAGLRDAGGAPIEIDGDVLLCRCGGSGDRPFCDGTHLRNGFSSDRKRAPGVGAVVDHVGTSITIHDNRAICAHVEYCVQGLPAVFDRTRRPWIDPDGASVAEIIAICEKCPSGALSYSIDGVLHRDTNRPAAVVVSDRGPLCTEGGVEVVGEPLAEGASPEHRTLCRCGASRNKPLCDGAHWSAGFVTLEDPLARHEAEAEGES